MADVVGTDVRMRDAERRVVGTVPFVLDHRVPGMVHARVVRSPLPHALIVSVDVQSAREMPGVLAVVTGADLAADPSIDPYFGAQRPDQPVLAIDKVRYAGEPVAIVVAQTERAAAAAVLFVDVTYDELPYVIDAAEARRAGAPAVHEDRPDNNLARWRLRHGDVDAGLARADRVYSGTYYSPPASHVPMEPHVCVASWSGNHLEVWTSAQAPHAVKTGLVKMFSLASDDVRVHTFNIGGGYGAKGLIKIEPMVSCAARAVGRPVRLELSRDEVFQTTGKHPATVELTTGVNVDGTIVARRMHVIYNAGAYAVSSPIGAGQGLTRANGPYTIPNVTIETEAVYTNTVPGGPFRGAMTSQLAFAYESQMDEMARDLGVDPVAFRRKNLLRDDTLYPTGEAIPGLCYDRLLDDLESAIGWGLASEPAPPGKARGKGLAIIIKNTLTPTRSEARLRLTGEGTVHIHSSSVEMGQGANATMVQITADALGIETDRLVMGFPDTAETPFDTMTASSRSTFSMGTALTRAAADLLGQLSALAAHRWRVDADTLSHDRGAVVCAERPELRIGWTDLLRHADVPELVSHGVFDTAGMGLPYLDPLDVKGPVSAHWHQGGAAAEVEVDLETGHVEVLRIHANCFAGKVVSPFRVRQQNQGCAIFGLGPTLFEELHYQDGTLSNPNLSDYMIPSILDVPVAITTAALETDDGHAELHGVGEMALPAVAPAVSNAVFAAVGVHPKTLPLTPERILRALDERIDSRGKVSADDRRRES